MMKKTLVFLIIAATFAACNSKKTTMSFNPTLDAYLAEIPNEFSQISDERKETLKGISEYIIKTQKEKSATNLIVICTHNSRRSHMGQIWLRVAAHYYGIKNVSTFSGGTESTAFNHRSVAALKRSGLKIEESGEFAEENNPIYELSLFEGDVKERMFSKKFSHKYNPQNNFGAIMVCSSADEACPFVPGAEARIAIPFDDPKAFDNTDLEAAKYDERCRDIALEMFFVMKTAVEKL